MFNLETAERIQQGKSAGRSFVDVDDDHPYELPTYGVGGWSKDGRWFLLNDRFDIWQPALDGSTAVNLTAGEGEARQIRFRLQRLDLIGGSGAFPGFVPVVDDRDECVDLTRPLLYSAYGGWTKQSAYWHGVAGKTPTPLLMADKSVGGIQKAGLVDRMIFTQQTFSEYPDW